MIGTRRDGDVVTIELQRHERRNALNTSLCAQIHAAVDGAVAGGARAIVVTGQGTAFSAGADLSGEGAYAGGFLGELIGALRSIEQAPVPVIAAVNGPAVGAGLQLALACDLRVAAPGAHFMIPVTRIAVAVDNWTVVRLSELAGGGVARGMLLAAQPLSAQEALHCGLANKVGDLAAAQAWAAELAQLAPLTLQHLKTVFTHAAATAEVTDEQAGLALKAWTSADMAEARKAREEGRKPEFRGE